MEVMDTVSNQWSTEHRYKHQQGFNQGLMAYMRVRRFDDEGPLYI